MLLALTGWESFFLMSFMAGVLATMGGYMSYAHGDRLVIMATCFFGSYMFMRGWTSYFGGYPSERDIFQLISQKHDTDND